MWHLGAGGGGNGSAAARRIFPATVSNRNLGLIFFSFIGVVCLFVNEKILNSLHFPKLLPLSAKWTK